MRGVRAFVPPGIRRNLRNVLGGIRSRRLLQALLAWIAGLNQAQRDRYALEIDHIRRFGFSIFPYDWAHGPEKSRVDVRRGRDGIPYVERNGGNLFFPATWSDERAGEYYLWLLKEQSRRSPHVYSHPVQTSGGRDVLLVDIGSAEGIWAFDNASLATEIILCEPKEEWQASLHRTFSQLGRPFVVMRKRIGMDDKRVSMKLDTLLGGRDASAIAIKVDVEGCEQKVLAGAAATIRRKSWTSWDICLYHKPDDEERILALFRDSCTYLKSVEVNPGYMVYAEETHPKAPLLRRGVARIVHEKIV